MRAFIVGVTLLVCTAANAADTTSANVVLPGCKDSIAGRGGYGAGYCHGVLDGMIIIQKNEWCTPRGSTLGQAVRVVVAYIDARLARQHEDFRDLALEGLREAWPCKP
jgi:Rap1a immunity proteins